MSNHPVPNNQTVPPRSPSFELPIILVALLVGGVLGWLSVARYLGYNAGMLDLGNMAQAIWSGTQGEPLVVTFPDGPLSRLSLHVELIYFLFVPFYALVPDPRLLLVAQAALFVLGAVPVYRLTMRQTGQQFAARALVLIYLFYPVAQTGVLFDFHGDTLAMPLLLFALDALDSRSWGRYAFFAALALSCKFYVAVPVAGIGGTLLLWGQRMGAGPDDQRRGAWRLAGGLTLLAAVVYGAVAFFVVRPLFAPPAGSGDLPATTGSYLHFYFGQAAELWNTFGDRLLNAVIVFVPALFVAWRGWRWLLAGLPLAAAMLLSSGPGGSYDYRYHHYALVVPFVVMATIVGTRSLISPSARPDNAPPPRRRIWRADLGMTVVSVVLFAVLMVDTPLNPLFWVGLPGQGLDPSAYGRTARDAQKDWFLANVVPPRAPIAASMFLAPHIANRETLYLVRYPDDAGAERLPAILPQVDNVLTDALFDYFIPLGEESYGGGVGYEHQAIALVLRDPSFGLVAEHDGLLLFERGAGPPRTLAQEVTVVEQSPAAPSISPLAVFGDTIGLLEASVVVLKEERGQKAAGPPAGEEETGMTRCRAVFEWVVAGPAPPARDHFAVSRIVNGAVSNGNTVSAGEYPVRYPHLPTLALLPPDRWQPGQIIREVFEVELPGPLPEGSRWRVEWYSPAHPYSYTTDARSRLPGQYEFDIK